MRLFVIIARKQESEKWEGKGLEVYRAGGKSETLWIVRMPKGLK
jgi:hypothetical protein